MRRRLAFAAALAAITAAAATAAPASAAILGGTRQLASVSLVPEPGHAIAGFSLDSGWVALAEDPTDAADCPEVVMAEADGGPPEVLTTYEGPTCQLGGSFWVRPGMRAIGNAEEKALWVVHNGPTALAVKASMIEPEVVLAKVTGITASGPFLGPVVASRWLRLFGKYSVSADGALRGGVISGNGRELWTAVGPVLPLGLDAAEHAVAVGADGSIEMWHAHGARYGHVPDARAKAAGVGGGQVLVLRSDKPLLDVRLLSGKLVRSWPVADHAAPLLDVDAPDHLVVYLAGPRVHVLDYTNGRDVVAARAPAGTTLIDAQIDSDYLAYALRGGPAGPGRVVVVRR